jgi:hypothetical protein
MRICKHCGFPRDEIRDFYPGRLYPSTRCKVCEKKRAKDINKRRLADPIKGKNIRIQRRSRNALRRSELRTVDNVRYKRDHCKRLEAQAKYFQKNKIKIYSRVNARLIAIPELRLRRDVGGSIRIAMKQAGGNKSGRSVLKYLPYTMVELRAHLESLWEPWMNWDNWGSYDKSRLIWQIDHITPQVSLPFDDFSHPNFLLGWDLSNLRPLESSQNSSKGCRPIL